MAKEVIALFCGVPPDCERCCKNDAKVKVTLPNQGIRAFCGDCLCQLLERGMEVECKDEYNT